MEASQAFQDKSLQKGEKEATRALRAAVWKVSKLPEKWHSMYTSAACQIGHRPTANLNRLPHQWLLRAASRCYDLRPWVLGQLGMRAVESSESDLHEGRHGIVHLRRLPDGALLCLEPKRRERSVVRPALCDATSEEFWRMCLHSTLSFH